MEGESHEGSAGSGQEEEEEEEEENVDDDALVSSLLLSTSVCLLHLSSLAETNTSASNGSTILRRIDEITLPLPLVASSHRLLLSPTRQRAIFGRAGGGASWENRGKITLNLDVNATMPGAGTSGEGRREG